MSEETNRAEDLNYLLNEIKDTFRKTKMIYRSNAESETAFDRAIERSEKYIEAIRNNFNQYAKEQVKERDEYWKGVLKEEIPKAVYQQCSSASHSELDCGTEYYEKEVAPKYK